MEKSKSITDVQAKKAENFIKIALEPKIKQIVEEANKILNTHGIQIGASVEWFIDKLEKGKK